MKALVVAGGSEVSRGLLQSELSAADLVLCADGGARHLAEIGKKPDILVGDMDSIDAGLLARLEASGVELVRAPAEKDETDAQLAVDLACARGADEIVLLGALGGRIDHTLGNMTLLVRAARRGAAARIAGDTCEIMAATGPVAITGRAGETVSILPAGDGVAVRYLDGLKYGTKEPLKLPIDSPVGVSNELTAETAHVEIDGWAYVVRITQ